MIPFLFFIKSVGRREESVREGEGVEKMFYSITSMDFMSQIIRYSSSDSLTILNPTFL
jgi:hypothetical protein